MAESKQATTKTPLLLLTVNYESSPGERGVCQVSATKRVLITGPREGSGAQPDQPGREPAHRPWFPSTQAPQAPVPPLPDLNTEGEKAGGLAGGGMEILKIHKLVGC